jgi:hypothetical protein
MDGGRLPVQVQAGPVIGQQPGRQAPVPRRLGVADRLHSEPVPRKPPGRQLVQRGHLLRLGAPQLQSQQAGEHPVVAEPGPLRVQRHHERAGPLQIVQHPLPAAAPGQQVGQLAVGPFQDRGPQQPPDVLTLPVQHLGQQVFRHGPFGPGELRREPLRVRVPGQRQRRQPQPRRPPLGPVHQQRQGRVSQPHPRGRQQLPRLGHAEPQIVRADLGQLAGQPQPVQPQPHVVPGSQHEPQLRRGPQHQQLQLPTRLVRAQLVHVVDHQPDPVPQLDQVLQQPLDDRPPVQIRRRRQLPDQRRPGRSLAQRAQHRQPEPLRVPLHPARPAPMPRAPPGPPPRSRTAAAPSYRCPAAPIPSSRAPPPPAARTARDGTPPLRGHWHRP